MSDTQKDGDKDGDFVSNPARYREASQPHASPEAAAQALSEFFKELSSLRLKHRIRDLYCVAQLAIVEAGGEEEVRASTMGFGNDDSFEGLAAMAYGYERKRREERIGRLLLRK
jgi:hypothetical protein